VQGRSAHDASQRLPGLVDAEDAGRFLEEAKSPASSGISGATEVAQTLRTFYNVQRNLSLKILLVTGGFTVQSGAGED
jgi:hypothetical protein